MLLPNVTTLLIISLISSGPALRPLGAALLDRGGLVVPGRGKKEDRMGKKMEEWRGRRSEREEMRKVNQGVGNLPETRPGLTLTGRIGIKTTSFMRPQCSRNANINFSMKGYAPFL